MFALSLDTGAVLLRGAILPIIEMGCLYGEMYISPDEVTLAAASDPYPNYQVPSVITALRMQRSAFSHFSCDETVCLCLGFQQLYATLSIATADDFVGIYGVYRNGNDRISVVLIDNNGNANRFTADLNQISVHPAHQMYVPEFLYEYQVIVGIPSDRFRRLVLYLRSFGMAVSALVTNTQVRLCVGNGEVVLRTQLDQCIIGGSVGEDPVTLVFGLYYIYSLLRASTLTNMVWLLGQSNGPSVMLNFPVGALGNLVCYFGSELPEDVD